MRVLFKFQKRFTFGVCVTFVASTAVLRNPQKMVTGEKLPGTKITGDVVIGGKLAVQPGRAEKKLFCFHSHKSAPRKSAKVR